MRWITLQGNRAIWYFKAISRHFRVWVDKVIVLDREKRLEGLKTTNMNNKVEKVYTIRTKNNDVTLIGGENLIAVQSINGNDAFGINANGEFCRVDKNKLVESGQEDVLSFSHILCLSGYWWDIEAWDAKPLYDENMQLFHCGDILQSRRCDKIVRVTKIVPEHKQYHISHLDGSEIETEDLDYDCRDKSFIKFSEQNDWLILSPRYVDYLITHSGVTAHLPWWIEQEKKKKQPTVKKEKKMKPEAEDNNKKEEATGKTEITLKEYAQRKSISYFVAWCRFNKGQIENAYKNEKGKVVVRV